MLYLDENRIVGQDQAMEKIAEYSSLEVFDAFLNSLEELEELSYPKAPCDFNHFEHRAPITRSSTNLRNYEDLTLFPTNGGAQSVGKEQDSINSDEYRIRLKQIFWNQNLILISDFYNYINP